MPPMPLLTGAHANLASEEWILQERQQLRALFNDRIEDFHQLYIDDISWLNEYMTGLCEDEPSKRDILQAMKTPSRFQSIRKLNSNFDLKGALPVTRLFSESSVRAESSTTTSSKAAEKVESKPTSPAKSNQQIEQRGSLIIHHDADDELENVEAVSTGGDSLDISEDSFALSSGHESRVPVEEAPQPLNEIAEVEEEDDEVVTVLKTPHAVPLHVKPHFATQEEFMDSPLAGKGVPQQSGDMDVEGSDKENIPQSPVRRVFSTPRPSDRSDSYVTAPISFPVSETPAPEEIPESVQVQQLTELQTEEIPNDKTTEVHQEEIIETKVPVATSPPEHQMQLPSLPTRAPLNMKKSFGVRKSHRTSLMETLAGRASIIPNRKTFFAQVTQNLEPTSSAEPVAKPAEPKPAPTESSITPLTTPTDEATNPVTQQSKEDNPKEKKEKDDTITIIDTELHLGDQRLQTKFMSQSQRIHDALNSLKLKSTPGQPLREAHQDRMLETETPAPVRTVVGQDMELDDEDDWIPRKDYSTLAQKLASGEPGKHAQPEEHIPAEAAKVPESVVEDPVQVDSISPPAASQQAPSPIRSPVSTVPISAPLPPSPSSSMFQSAAAHAMDVIRNALGVIIPPHPSDPTEQTETDLAQPGKASSNTNNIYPRLSEDLDPEPMADIQNENFTVHYDDRASMDSTYFTQSDGPSQPLAEPMQQTHRQSNIPDNPSRATMLPPPKPKVDPKPKPVPVSIRVPTALQRQKEQQKKIATTTIYPTLTQSKSVPDLASPGKLPRDDTSRMSNVSIQSTGSFMKGAGQIKALNAAKMAKQREEKERERKAAMKFEMEKKRQEAVQKQKQQDDERRKQLNTQKKTITKKPAAEPMRPAKKLPPSPQKKLNREIEVVKPGRPGAMALPAKGVKHALEQEDSIPRTGNYNAAAKSMDQPQHGQDNKRRRTEDIEEKEIITGKPMRVSVINKDTKPTKSIGEAIRQPYTAEPKKGIKISSAHQYGPPAKNFMAPAEGVKFSNDPIPFGKPVSSQGKRSGPLTKETPYPPSESIILPEIDSEYSDSEDESPKKTSIVKPSWAESPVLMAQLKRQQLINPDDVFGEIKPPAIDDIFRDTRKRGHSTFRPRSSSANWSGQDKLTREEIEEYAKTMGYAKP